METILKCRCSEVIIKARSIEGDEVVRAKILIIKGNSVFAVCKACNNEVELPLEKSITKGMGPELYLDK